MAIENAPYSSERYAASRELALGKLGASTNNSANEVIGRHRFFTTVKILEARACIQTAAKGSTSQIDVYKGTTSIGAIAVADGTAGAVVDASLTDTDFEATDDLIFKCKIATDTGKAFLAVQYQERFA
jgi:hypothetical protein